MMCSDSFWSRVLSGLSSRGKIRSNLDSIALQHREASIKPVCSPWKRAIQQPQCACSPAAAGASTQDQHGHSLLPRAGRQASCESEAPASAHLLSRRFSAKVLAFW